MHPSKPVSTAPVDARPCLLERYLEVRASTEELAHPLSAEDQMVQSMADASPTKWHRAHTTWFFETFLLLPHAPGYSVFDDRFTYLFNSYYKRLGGHPIRAQRGLWSRPSHEDVAAYRAHVDRAMENWLHDGVPPHIEPLVELGLNHEQQHQELILTDIQHALWLNPLHPAYLADETISKTPPNAISRAPWIDFPGGLHDIGHAGPGFCFDSETPRHQEFLRPFRLASRLVTNGEYLRFIADGGYERPELWLSEGWDEACANGWQAPLYWARDGDRWLHFTLRGVRPVDPAEPVCHVSYYEADAYARWAGARLPLESEWEVAASTLPVEGNFLDQRRFHPAPAPAASGLQQMFGDLWEWTASPYVGYPGFQPDPGALGEYNGKFMSNQMVLRGGSCATPRSHIRASYRNFFPPRARWQFMGIRLAQ